MAVDLVDAIMQALPDIKSGSLAVFGDIFGGRVDNIHHVVSAAHNDDGSILIEFDGGETLTVWDPDGIEVGPHDFRVARATRVRWEWFYYGRPQLAENRYVQEHRVQDGGVLVSTNADWYQPSFAPSIDRPAVEILAMGDAPAT
jgi:hypothetical protein